MNLAIIISVAKLYSLEFLAYPTETILLVLRRAFEIGLLVLFWYLISKDNAIDGFQIIPYILVATGVLYLSLGHVFPQASLISKDIKDGSLSSILIRPINELNYELGAYIGKNVFQIGFAMANILLGLILVGGPSILNVSLFVVSLVPAVAIGYSLNVIIASLAFWIVEIGNIRLITYFIIRIVSGMFMPLTFFPGALAVFLQLLPFAQLAFVPSFVLTSDDIRKSILLIAVGFIEAVIMVKLARFIWAKGLREYGAIGI